MEQIIKSILDQDQYKMSMQQAVLELFPEAVVEYRFKNRWKQRFNREFLDELQKQIDMMWRISLTESEYLWLKSNIWFFKPQYVEFLKNYRYNPCQVKISLTEDNNLEIIIRGFWRETILWEVPLMALISELYFKMIEPDWDHDKVKVQTGAFNKISGLSKRGCRFAEFGTRRRKSFEIQDEVIGVLKRFQSTLSKKTCFVGTSNLYFAKKYGVKSTGTVAHEWTQGMQALESINHCNYYAMQNWVKVYNTSLGTYLPDTITTDMFLQNFNRRFAMLFDGTRHDSSCPFVYTDKMVGKYKELNIDPMSKYIIFSDNLKSLEDIFKIQDYCENKIQNSFGIGTWFTNDIPGSIPLNMVIKLWSVNGFPVVKLSDAEGKEMGDPEAVKTMKWIVKNQLQRKNETIS